MRLLLSSSEFPPGQEVLVVTPFRLLGISLASDGKSRSCLPKINPPTKRLKPLTLDYSAKFDANQPNYFI